MTEDFPSLRDEYAQVRTVLANERTLLAYARTALTCLLTGMGFITLFDSPLSIAVGMALMPIGIAVFGVGLWRFRAVRGAIATPGPGVGRMTGGMGPA